MTGTAARSAAADGTPAALVSRFAQSLSGLWPEGADPGARLGLAVSGGPDSLAMLLLAHAAIPGRFEVATVDHGLRPAAAQECAMVAQVCTALGVLCTVLRVHLMPGNVQAEARAARYAAMLEWAAQRRITALATAHHADDQAETLLMRLNRGSGVSGLAGIRDRAETATPGVILIRPLLPFRKAELAEVITASGLAAAQDPSNADDRYDRARLRKALAQSDWIDPLALATSATNMADADDALDWAATREWGDCVTVADSTFRYRPTAPRAVILRVVARIIQQFGGQARGKDLARLIEKLSTGEGGNLAGVLASVERNGDWLFRAEPPRRTG